MGHLSEWSELGLTVSFGDSTLVNKMNFAEVQMGLSHTI